MDISRGMEFITTTGHTLIATGNPDNTGRFVAIEYDGTHHVLYTQDVQTVTKRVWETEE